MYTASSSVKLPILEVNRVFCMFHHIDTLKLLDGHQGQWSLRWRIFASILIPSLIRAGIKEQIPLLWLEQALLGYSLNKGADGLGCSPFCFTLVLFAQKVNDAHVGGLP